MNLRRETIGIDAARSAFNNLDYNTPVTPVLIPVSRRTEAGSWTGVTLLRCDMGTTKKWASSKTKAKLRKQLADKYGWKCYYCGANLTPDDKWDDFYYCEANGYYFPQLDHRTPKSLGGGNSIDNLVLSCRRCNRDKSATTEGDYIARRNSL